MKIRWIGGRFASGSSDSIISVAENSDGASSIGVLLLNSSPAKGTSKMLHLLPQFPLLEYRPCLELVNFDRSLIKNG